MPQVTDMTRGVTYLVDHAGSDLSLRRRSTTGSPPAVVSDTQTGATPTHPAQGTGFYDSTRDRIVEVGSGLTCFDADSLAEVAYFPITESGVFIDGAHDPVGDRYYLMVRPFFGGSGGYFPWRLVSVAAENGSGETAVTVAGAGRVLSSNALTKICRRSDGSAGVTALDVTRFGSGSSDSYVSLVAPDGSVTNRTILPTDPGHDSNYNSFTGKDIECFTGSTVIGVLYAGNGLRSAPGALPYGGTWSTGSWTSQWTTTAQNTASGDLSPLTNFSGSQWVTGVLTADPLDPSTVWFGSDNTNYYDGTANRFCLFKIDQSGSHSVDDIGHWHDNGDFNSLLVACGQSLTGIPPLRQWQRNDGLVSNARRRGSSTPSSRQASIRRGPRGTYT